MSDAAVDEIQVERKKTGKELWGKGIALARIWREVLGFFSGRDRDRLNEFKREMWLLLVAAGSGYLARCWHRTLTAKPQLTDYAHADREEVGTNEEANTSKPIEQAVLEEPSPNVSLKKFTATLETELAPRPPKRSFSPKAISKKLFHSDSTKRGKAGGKKDGQAESSTADESSGADSNSASTSGAAVVGHRKKGPWSTFKSKKSFPSKENASGVENPDNSPSPLRETADLSHRSSREQRTGNGSSSSRSLRSYFEEGELDTDSVVSSSPGQSGRSQSGAFVSTITTPEVAETIDEPPGSVSSGEVSSNLSRRNVVEANAVSPMVREQQSPDRASTGSEGKDGNAPTKKIANDSSETASRRDGSTSVAEVVAQIEKAKLSTTNGETSSGGAAHRRRAALKGNLEGAVREKVRSLKDLVEEVEEVEVQPGGKGKRRAADGVAAAAKGTMDGQKMTLPGALLTGKRTKDSEEDASKLGPREAVGFTLASITGKRMKDVDRAKNDCLGREAPSPGEPSLSSAVGSVDLSQVFFGFDEAFLASVAEEKSPLKYYKRSRHVRANTRRMRESPKPVSALESCLRAQFPEKEEGSRVARSLNFSSSLVGAQGAVSRQDSLEVGAEAPVPKSDSLSPGVPVGDSRANDGTEQQAPRTESPLGLPILKASPSKGSGQRADYRLSEKRAEQTPNSVPNYPRNVVLEDRGSVVSSQSRLNDVLWRRTTLARTLKKRKVSQACSGSTTSSPSMKVKGYELEALVLPPMEGLLFSFGVGIGVMSLTSEADSEIERLSSELRKSNEEIQNLNNLLKQARELPEQASATVSTQVMVVGSLAIEKVEKVTGEGSGSNDPLLNRLGIGPPSADEAGIEMFDLVRKEAPETPQQTEHMAELEAELEAELDALTCGVLDGGGRSTLNFDELDPEGVAGVADRDLGVEGLPALLDWDDDNDDFITEEYTSTGGGVPPRELRRLLRKVQSSRQELIIAELEADLHETVARLQAMEKELQRFRESSTPVDAAAASSSTGFEAERPESSAAATSSEWSGRFDYTSSPKARDKIVSSAVPPPDEEASPKLDIHNIRHTSVKSNQLVEETEKSRNETIEGTSPRREPAYGLREALVRKLGSSPLNSQARDPELSLRRSVSASGDVGSGLRRSRSTELEFDLLGQAVVSEAHDVRPGQANARSLLREKSADLGAQVTNDAVFDEFLSSVLGSEDEGGQSIGGSSVVSSPLVTNLPSVFSLDEAEFPIDDDDGRPATGMVDLQDVLAHVDGKPVDEDLDQVVGELLKRDTSSVKNALNAFLLWEASETENVENKNDVVEKEVEKEPSPRYSRRAAGKNPTPQKTLSATGSPLKTSVLASRLEQLARSAFTTEKMPYLDSKSPRRRGGTSDQTTRKAAGEDDLEVFQPPVPQSEERTVKMLSRRDRQPSIRKDLGASLTIRRDAGAPPSRRQSLSSEGRREAFKSETPVFGSMGKDFETLLEARREMRYSSSRVELSAAKPATQEPDVRPSRHKQREDASRAGTNSPTGRRPTSTSPFYPSPKPKGSRLGFENRLYKNPTSDWLAEVGSPPDK